MKVISRSESRLNGSKHFCVCVQVFGQWNPGCVERVKKIRDYAFVHFSSRDDAVLAMDHLNGTEVEGSCIEVTLAKPVDKEQYTRYQKASKGVAPTVAAPEPAQQSYVYQCDPYTLTYYGYPYNTLIGPNRDYFVKGESSYFRFLYPSTVIVYLTGSFAQDNYPHRGGG